MTTMRRKRWVHRMRAPGVLLVVILATSLTALSPAAAEVSDGATSAVDPTLTGEWSPPFEVGVPGMHASLLATGQVLLFELPDDDPGTEAHLIDPTTGMNIDVSVPFELDLHCSAHSILPDGRLLVTGGTIYGAYPRHDGIRDTTIFDPTSREWSSSGLMSDARWYGTNVTMPNGSTLIVTGEVTTDVLQRTMESYDPTSGTVTKLPASADSNTDPYAHLFVMPAGRVFRAGPNPVGMRFNPSTNAWSSVARMNYGWRYGSGAVLLPGLRRVLTAGGTRTSLANREPGMAATRTAEIINLGVASPKWSYAKPMTFPRIHPNMVLLADGTVLTVGGARKHISTEPVRNAELFNPATGNWSVMAAQAADRAYHSTALLLPDGRVMSAGSERSNLPTTAEYYSPPYLFRGPRPTIIDAPASISYGQSFSVTTLDAPDIARVALVRLGSTTHATSFDQRYVDLRFTRATGELQVSSPASGNLAPPGPYMLFVLNTEGVPAVAEIVQVGASQL